MTRQGQRRCVPLRRKGGLMGLVIGSLAFVGASACGVEGTGLESSQEASGLSTPNPEHGTGYRIPTKPEDIAKSHHLRIVAVSPNALAIQRTNEELAAAGLPTLDPSLAAAPESETQTLFDPAGIPAAGALGQVGTSNTASALPSSVDNSVLGAFPPVGNQGSEGSCVAWATTYYSMSHETCLARKCNNKTDAGAEFSPKWTYNMINGGVDEGSYQGDAFTLLNGNGAAKTAQLPYRVGDYRSWDTSNADWTSAISYRLLPVQYEPGVISTNLATVKQLLANGHVMTFATMINDWKYGTIGKNPDAGSPYAGQSIAIYQSINSADHMMTIVGYNDGIWVDLNGNGRVDPGESGALKIANSWGTGWGHSGFMWVAYDALNGVTAVAGGPNPPARGPLVYSETAYYQPARPTYNPTLIAQFTVNSSDRDTMRLLAGSSPTTSSSPTKLEETGAFLFQGGSFDFDGGTAGVDGHFALDLSDVATRGTALNYYLEVTDASGTKAVTVKNFQLFDVALKKTIPLASGLPTAVLAKTDDLRIGYDL